DEVRESLPPEAFARVMPAARRALKERRLTPDEVTPSGPGGRILKEDVDRAIAESGRARAPAPMSAPARVESPAAQPAVARPATPTPASGSRTEEVVPMSPIRRRIAERLVQSQQTAALLTTFNEIDMSAVSALRKEHQERFLD